MGMLSRMIFREVLASALLGTVLFSFVIFLQRLGRLFELLVRSSASLKDVGYLFLLILPFVLTFTVPLGVLVGVLIGLSRMSADGEIIAMRAAGVPSRRVITPILVFATLATLVAASASLWLTPWAIRETYRVLNQLLASQMTAEVQPRVFQEQFSDSNKILYVGDVVAGPSQTVRWRNVFLADLTPPEQRSQGPREAGEGPRITVAAEAIAAPEVEHNRILLRMWKGSTHEAGKDPAEYFSTTFPEMQQSLEASRPAEVHARAFSERDTLPLAKECYAGKLDPQSRLEALIELHQRLCLPPACLLLALIGIPLGVSARKGGKSAAFVLTVSLAFVYYMGLISLIGLARHGALPVEVAAWTPNLLFALAAVVLLLRLEKPGDRDLLGSASGRVEQAWRWLRSRMPPAVPGLANGGGFVRLPVLAQVIDTYILTTFLSYLALLLASFVLMTHVYTFFELLSDIMRHQIPMSRVATYHFFLTPKLIYDSLPVSVLVATLVTFGVLTKHNEVTAFKACGVSLHRLAAPVLFTSALISGLLFAFDHYYVAEANRTQDAIRNEIKGRPVQTYLRPDRTWIFGKGSRIYYYRYYEPVGDVMVGVNVYELDPSGFQLRRHIYAEQARWEPSLRAWIYQNGWKRDIAGVRVKGFETFQVATFPELDEPPGYFRKEVLQEKQMDFRQLGAYIRELQQSGFDTVRLQVQLQKKFSVPLFALIMAMISVPFAFLTGNRGAMAGVGVSFGIAIAYWAVSQLFEQVGNLNQLPAAVAAWSPDVIFSLAGLYLLARMRT